MENQTNQAPTENIKTKFCKHCAAKIPEDAIICTACGRQVEEIKSNSSQPSIVINNDNNNINSNVNKNTAVVGGGYVRGRAKNKWVALILCALLGFVGAHKFYEGKAGMGILYLCTGGLLFIGVIIDFISILAKPNPYYV
ncbi:MAG: TM2 domain-containing protein [Clostridia bacterium]|nr:TM2 domain-containing protein [Clostridia bacterium]